jgi:hypothetical protein
VTRRSLRRSIFDLSEPLRLRCVCDLVFLNGFLYGGLFVRRFDIANEDCGRAAQSTDAPTVFFLCHEVSEHVPPYRTIPPKWVRINARVRESSSGSVTLGAYPVTPMICVVKLCAAALNLLRADLKTPWSVSPVTLAVPFCVSVLRARH